MFLILKQIYKIVTKYGKFKKGVLLCLLRVIRTLGKVAKSLKRLFYFQIGLNWQKAKLFNVL